jgi:hypothetical protein
MTLKEKSNKVETGVKVDSVDSVACEPVNSIIILSSVVFQSDSVRVLGPGLVAPK